MPRAKKRPTYIKSLRVDSDDYQKFIKALREKENQNQPKLF